MQRDVMERLIARFQDRALVPHGECLDWPGEKDKDGYGIVRAGHRRSGGVRGRAPRVAWAAAHPDEAMPTVVRHSCDRPSCAKTEHLLAGEHADNARDARERGRHRAGMYAYLDLVPCPICERPFKPVIWSAGRRKETCSKRCAGLLRVQRGMLPPHREVGTGCPGT